MHNTALQQTYQHPLLTKKDLKELMDAHTLLTIKRNDYLLQEGQVANEYFILVEGLARSYVIDFQGQDITTDFYVNGSLIIEAASLFQRIPAQESIMALTDCVCWKICFQQFQSLFHHIEGFREWGRAWMANQLFQCRHRAVAMITQTATERYVKLLTDKPSIIQKAPLKNIATYLGITDTSLSRIRKELATH